MKVRKFNFWCHKVLPLVYDNSLSYYEVLCKLVNKVNEIIDNVSGFKVADPIEWNITSQYEANTMVVDDMGNAYISLQPVPKGIALDNEDYWIRVFNYGEIINDIKGSITTIATSIGTTPKDLAVGDLVWFANDLYEITSALNAGALLIPNTNCVATTLQEWIDKIKDDVADLETAVDGINDEISDIQGDIEGIGGDIETINESIGDINDAIEALENKKDKANIYDTVSAMIADTDLENGMIAITRGYYSVNDGGGGIYKIVSAQPAEPRVTLSNGLYASMVLKKVITPQMFGAKGDGTNDDTQAFVKMFACAIDDIYIPSGSYVVNDVIIAGNDKRVNNEGTFTNCKPIWRREFDLKQSKLFGVGREYTLSSTDSYVEALCYDTKRNKFYLGTRNYSTATEYMDLIVLNGDTYATESTHTFQIAAVASMSYNPVDDKIYVATTGSGAGKTNALYTIAVSGWSLAGPLTVPNNEQFTMFDSEAKVFVQFYIPQDSNNVYMKVYDATLTTLLNQKMVTLLSTDKPQQGFCVYDGHVYAPTYNSILEIDYISGEVERLTILYQGTANYEEMEDLCVANGVVFGVGHRDGETGGKERFYIYNYDNFKNYDTVTPLVIYKRVEAIAPSSLVVPANGAASTGEFDRPTYAGYSIVAQMVEDATGGGQGNLIYSLKSSQHDVRIFNPTSSAVTLSSLYVRIVYVRNDIRESYGL